MEHSSNLKFHRWSEASEEYFPFIAFLQLELVGYKNELS